MSDTSSNSAGHCSNGEDSLDSDASTAKQRLANISNTTPDSSYFDCNVCLDVAKNPVVSHCGHLFCWPCLYTWLQTRPDSQTCPVCKSAVSRDKVVPIYGRGCTDNVDPRTREIPTRPAGTHTAQPDGDGSGGGGGGIGESGRRRLGQSDYVHFPFGFNFHETGPPTGHVSFGIGAFPFGMISLGSWNVWGGGGGGGDGQGDATANDGTDDENAAWTADKMFLVIGLLTLLSILYL